MPPLLRKRRVLAAKVESIPGTAEVLAAGDAGYNVFDSEIQAQIDFLERPGQSAFSPLPGTLGAYGGQVTFATEIFGSGNAGSPSPAWASAFLLACGMSATADVFTPETLPPEDGASGAESLTIAAYEHGVKKVLRGCMGNAVFRFTAGQAARIEFTFTGIWGDPTDVAILAPTYPTERPPRFASAVVRIGSWVPKVSEITLDLGNEVVLREDANDESGFHMAVVAGRRITGTIDPEATLIATHDIFADWKAGTERALSFELGGSGSADGNTIQIAAPALQWTNLQEGDRNAIQIDSGEFQLNRSAAAGDDELSITFS